MVKQLSVDEFLSHSAPLFDVRSPIEFHHATIPQAISLPLFEDHERAAVGTLYKKMGEQAALLEGLRLTGQKLSSFAEIAMQHPEGARIFCFRGGLRSQSMAWLFELARTPCFTLKGGYKAFRRFALSQFKKPFSFKLLGGLTGSGKTAKLKELKQSGEQIIDLEALASHKGSAFGQLGLAPQPSSEQFENLLALELFQLEPSRPIWIEDESRMIGTCKIPDALFEQMAKAPLYMIETKMEERIKRLIEEYGAHPIEVLLESVKKISRKLGSEATQKIESAIRERNLEIACTLLLKYYDKAYLYHIEHKRGTPWIPLSDS